MHIYLYSHFTYTRLIAEDGELAIAEPSDIDNNFAIIHLSGQLNCIDCDNPAHIESASDIPFELQAIAKDCTYILSQCVGHTEWVCIQNNGTGHRDLAVQQISGTYTLPAGTAFITIYGQVTADGLTAVQDDYFRPRTQDLEVTGDGYIVLIN